MAEWSQKWRYILITFILALVMFVGLFLILRPRVAGAESSPPPLKAVLASFGKHLTYAEIRFAIRGESPRTVRLHEAKTLPDALFFFWEREGGRYSWQQPEVRAGAWFLRGVRNPGPFTNSSLPCPVLDIRVVAFPGPRYVPEQMYCLNEGKRLMSLTLSWIAEGGRLRPKTIHVITGGSTVIIKVLEVRSALPRKGGRK